MKQQCSLGQDSILIKSMILKRVRPMGFWQVVVLLKWASFSVEATPSQPRQREQRRRRQEPPSSRKDSDADGLYLIGTGIYDITGPAAQINFMGYARPSQTAHGIHQRLRARAFIMAQSSSSSAPPVKAAASSKNIIYEKRQSFASTTASQSRWIMNPVTVIRNYLRGSDDDRGLHQGTLSDYASEADPDRTVCFVSIDIGMGSDLLNARVLKRLDDLLPVAQSRAKYNSPTRSNDNTSHSNVEDNIKRLCHLENLSISGTHTHSAPAGFLQYALFQITSLGFSEEVLQVYVEGVAQALLQAYQNLQPGTITMAHDLLYHANINRSPSSYLLNPADERDAYVYMGNTTDKTMLQLNFVTQEHRQPIGALNWFAVHGTSMNSSNLLISGDNKGYASYLLERHMNGRDVWPGHGRFVAAFASTNLGDVSPNTAGPHCLDTGLPCDGIQSSTCRGMGELCVATGPGRTMLESTEIIGRKQYEMALQLMQQNHSNASTLTGPVAFVHSFVDMSNITVPIQHPNGTHAELRTCRAALGYSFAAGTTDGPGDFDFTQGTNTSNAFWNMMGGFLSSPSAEQIACQAPKPILLNVGKVNLPYPWDPNVVPISIFRVGQLFILNVPGEFTTMAGRRLRRAVYDMLEQHGGPPNAVVAIAGLANSYSHYITTPEEYAAQRYEAASTLYGQHTLAAYVQEFRRLVRDLMQGVSSRTVEPPPDLSHHQISLIPPAEMDTIGVGFKFGSVAMDAEDSYHRSSSSSSNNSTSESVVVVSFRSANPRNDPRIQGTFLTVDRLREDDGTWQTIYVDGDWCTQYHWKGGWWGTSFAEMYWYIPADTPQGLYRLCHYGSHKSILTNMETLVHPVPDWFISNLLGSYLMSMMVNAWQFAISTSPTVRRWMDRFGHSRLKEFSGCSKTFLVRSEAENEE